MKTTFLGRSGWMVLSACVFWGAGYSSRADVLERWTTNQVSTNYFTLDSVTYAKGRYVAYGTYSDYGVLLSSDDGKNWSLRLDGAQGSGFSFAVALAYTGSRFFAFGGFGISATSTDGITWTTFQFHNALGAAYGGGVYAAVINDQFGGAVYDVFTSTNGVNWTPHNVNASMGDIAYGAGLFVAIGISNGQIDDSGHTYTSSSGSIWTQRDIPGGRNVSFNNGLFIVPYGVGTNLVSLDGINWAELSTGITSSLGKVQYANGLFFAPIFDFNIYLATSADGTNWWRYSQPLPGGSLATDGGRLVTVGGTYVGNFRYNGYIYYSDPLVSLRMANNPVQVVLSGLVGRSYQIQSTDNLNTFWQSRLSLQLPTNPFYWSDPTATNSPQRYYRAVLLPP